MKVVAIIQSRMGSTRLPGKVLQPLLGEEPVLGCVINRVRRARALHDVIVATTTASRDDAIVDCCCARGWSWFRGNEDDVLGRYWQTALANNADVVVRVTSDCPLIDPEIIDCHVARLLTGWRNVDFVTNMMRQTFPLGLAVEAMPFDVLTRMERLSTTPYLREHVTTLAYERPELFLVDHVLHGVDLSRMRWTVDTPEDLAFIRRIFDHFGHDHFSWREVLSVLTRHPEWAEINRNVGSQAGGLA